MFLPVSSWACIRAAGTFLGLIGFFTFFMIECRIFVRFLCPDG